MVAQFYLNVLIVKLFYGGYCGIASELVEASGIHLVECVADTTLIIRAIEGYLIEGVIIVSGLLLITYLLALVPFDATNGWHGHLAPFTTTHIFMIHFVGYCSVFHHAHIVGECWVNVNYQIASCKGAMHPIDLQSSHP